MSNSFWTKLPRPITALAPMEDVTDAVFRQVVLHCGRPSVFFTEFTSAQGLFSPGRESVIHRLRFSEQERPVVAQIWGTKPEYFFKASQLIKEMGFDGLDLNMGCPVAKIVKKGGCAGLIENPLLAKEIFQAAREGAAGLPVSIKTRIGFKEIKTEEWLGFLLELEPDVITVHGRIAKNLLKYKASWEEVAKVVSLRDKMNSSTLIIGNGDIKSLDQVHQKSAQFKVDGVMIGRGILHNLFLFNERMDLSFKDLNLEKKMELLEKHILLFEEVWQGQKYFGELKKFFKYYASGFRGASQVRLKLVESNSLAEVKEVIEEALEHQDRNEQDPMRVL